MDKLHTALRLAIAGAFLGPVLGTGPASSSASLSVVRAPAPAPREARAAWIELRLPLLTSNARGESPPLEERSSPWRGLTPPAPTTGELLHELDFACRCRRLGSDLPATGEIECGSYLRADDAVRAPIKLDRRFLLEWGDGGLRFETGYWLTYIGSEAGAPSYLRHGPWGGVSLEF